MIRYDYYEVRVGDDIGDPDYWNRRLQDVDLRIHNQELIEKDWRSAVRELQENGIKRIDEAITPLLEQLEQDAQLGALFISESTATVEVKTGIVTIGLSAANRKRFAPAAYLALVTRDAPYAVMLGRLVSYNRETASLVVDVDRTYGSGAAIRSNWVVSATSHIDYLAENVYRTAGGGISATTVEGALTELVSILTPKSRSLTAGLGLSGGGDLSENREVRLDLGYTDARYVRAQDYDIHRHPFSEIDETPTNLAGYGINDAYTKTQIDAALANKSSNTHQHQIGEIPGLETALNSKQATIGYTPENTAHKGQAGGYAALGPDGKVLSTQLPADGSYQGVWDASTNTPAIASGEGTSGDFFFVSVAGSTVIDANTSWAVGDQVRFSGSEWEKIPTANAVTSVSGKTGAVDLLASDIGGLGGLATKSTIGSGDVENGSIGNVDLENMPTGMLKGRGSAGSGPPEDLTSTQVKSLLGITIADIASLQSALNAKLDDSQATSFGLNLLNDADAAAGRTTLGLGTAATQSSGAFAPASHVGSGGASAHPDATTSTSGFMSSGDKTKLNGIAAGANAYSHPSGDGNLHVPATSTGSNKKVLTAGSTAGSMTWSLVDFLDIANRPTTLVGYGISDAYSSNTVDTLLSGKQNNIGYTPENVANKGVANGYAGLDGSGKVPTTQLPAAVLGALQYQNVWNASTNTPAIPTAASGNKGHFYKVSVAGATNVSGITDWKIGDWIVSNGASWDKVDNTDQVSSVAGRTGAVTLTNADVTGLGSLATKSTILTADLTNANVTNVKLANVATATLKGRVTAGAGSPEDLTVAQVKTLLGMQIADVNELATSLSVKFDKAGGNITGDVHIWRSNTPTTGYTFYGNSGSVYFGWDGSKLRASHALHVEGVLSLGSAVEHQLNGNILGPLWNGGNLHTHIETRAGDYATSAVVQYVSSLATGGGGEIALSHTGWVGIGTAYGAVTALNRTAGVVDYMAYRNFYYFRPAHGWALFTGI